MKIYELFEQRTVISKDGIKKTYPETFCTTQADDIKTAISNLCLPSGGWTESTTESGLFSHQSYKLSDGRIVVWVQHIYMV
jgi:hypothetical protein